MRSILWCCLIGLLGCFEPGKALVVVDDGSLIEEEIQQLEDDCENGNDDACDELADALMKLRRMMRYLMSRRLQKIGMIGRTLTPQSQMIWWSGSTKPLKTVRQEMKMPVRLLKMF